MANTANGFTNQQIENELVSALDAAYPDLVLRDHPTLGIATHEEEYGKNVVLPVQTGYAANEANDMPTAVAQTSKTKRTPFTFTHFTRYTSEDVNMADNAYTQDPDVAAVEALVNAGGNVLQNMGEITEKALWSDGFGTLSSIKANSGAGPYVLTLALASDAYWFGIDDILVSKVANNSAALDTGTAIVTSVDTIAGKLTVTAAGGWTPANTHVIGKSGVMAASTSPIAWMGIPGFNPDINNRPQPGENFSGVDRSTYPEALAGFAIDGTGLSIKQALNALLSKMSNRASKQKFRLDTVMLNNADYQRHIDDLGTARVPVEVTGEMGVNYHGTLVIGPKGEKLSMVPATFVKQGRVQVFASSALIIAAPGPKFIDKVAKNGSYIEVPTDDVARLVARANGYIYVRDPSAFGNVLV